MRNFIFTATIFFAAMVFTGCKKDLFTDNSEVAGENPLYKVATTYAVTPSIGVYTPNSTSNITLKGSCGNYAGGMIKAKVISQSGNQFVIKIEKQNGGAFSVAGVAKVKAASVCGGLAGSANYAVGATSVLVSIPATFTQGVTHFYPVVESSSGGTKYFAEPIMVYTLPSYASGPYVNGTVLGTVDGVTLYASSSTLLSSTSTYQCTDWCKRFYSAVYGLTIGGWGNANVWYNNTSGVLSKYANGGSTPPRVGDILCFSGGSGGFGHVSIITEVGSSQIKVSQQNAGASAPIGGAFSRSGNTITPWSGYTCQGWMRKP